MLRLLLVSFAVLIAPHSASANVVLKAATFAMLERCQADISGPAELIQQGVSDDWTRVPSKGKITERFYALEVEGIDIANQDDIVRNPTEFSGIELFQTRLMLILERGNDAVAFVSSALPPDTFTCSFTTTFVIPFAELEDQFTQFATRRTQSAEKKLAFTGKGDQYFSIAMMPDQSAKAVSGAKLSIAATAELRE
ncbi:hypothetical protein [uncultured Tateyamaria sp.]|uniref:hypothetical protein n=1 Tax=uncultured Tateyamaria sp. TaxID=455651 RepID=UPI002606D3AF|nr:hypothetical protein [uncultured Tateyamaria sp.]